MIQRRDLLYRNLQVHYIIQSCIGVHVNAKGFSNMIGNTAQIMVKPY